MTPQTSAAVEALYASGVVPRPQNPDGGLFHYAEGSWWWVWTDGTHTDRYPYPDSTIFESLVRACWAKGWQPRQCFGDHFAVEGCNTSHMVFDDPIAAMLAALNGGG